MGVIELLVGVSVVFKRLAIVRLNDRTGEILDFVQKRLGHATLNHVADSNDEILPGAQTLDIPALHRA